MSTWTAQGQSNTWQAALTSEPQQVYFDGTRGTKVASLVLVDGSNKWYWASNVLYVYATSDPDSAYISPGIEASVRRYCITAVSKSYISIDGVDSTKSGLVSAGSGYNVSIDGGGNNILKNFKTSEGYHSGIFVGNSSDSNLIDTVEATLNGGIILDSSTNGVGIGIWLPSADNNVIRYSNVHDNYGSGITNHGLEASVDGPDGSWIHHNTTSGNGGKGISVTMALNTLVEYNTVSGNGIGATSTTTGDGIRVGAGDLTVPFGTGNIVRFNLIFNNTVNAITLFREINPQVYYNVAYGNGSDANDEGNGIEVFGADGGTIYNNVLYNSRKYGLLFQTSEGANVVAKNNIIHTSRGRTAGMYIYANAAGSVTSDYNIVYNITDYASSAGTQRSLAAWQSFSGQDAHSLTSDPLFVSTSTPDFTLLSTSPAIGAGVNLGSDYDDAIKPGSTWPSSITTVDQDSYGSGWEMGAYAYTHAILSAGSPSGQLSQNTSSTTMSLSSDISATCKYGTIPNTAYSSIANTFTNTNSTAHSVNLTDLLQANASYNYYVRCLDGIGNVNLSDYPISFRVQGSSAGTGYSTTTPTPTPSPAVPSPSSGPSAQSPAPSPSPTSSFSPTSPPSLGNRPTPAQYNLKEGMTVSAINSNDPDVYIINDSGFKRLFLNPIIFSFYGHLGGFRYITTIASTVRDVFETSSLFRNCETNDNKVYAVEVTGEDTGTLHHLNLSADQAILQDPEFFKKVFCINTHEFNWYTRDNKVFGEDYTAVSQIPRYKR